MLSHLQDNNTQNSIKTNQAEEEEEEEASCQKMHSFLSSPTPKSEIRKSANKSPPELLAKSPKCSSSISCCCNQQLRKPPNKQKDKKTGAC
jgi:hypothetical protein